MERVKLYFVDKKGEVIQTLLICADMAQGFGFISELEFKKG